MLRALVQNCKNLIINIERNLFFGKYPPHLNFAEIAVSNEHSLISKQFSIHDIMKESILWAVPKNRRTIERRMMRRIGSKDRLYKLQLPQSDMLVCNHCGHDFKRGYLCKNCYNKVMEETRSMQEEIIKELKLDSIDKEVVVLYQGEKEEQSSEFWKGKRIVEMPKERPSWFSRNLLQKTTTTKSDSKDVKPDHLG